MGTLLARIIIDLVAAIIATAVLIILHVFDIYPEQWAAYEMLGVIASPEMSEFLKWVAFTIAVVASVGFVHATIWARQRSKRQAGGPDWGEKDLERYLLASSKLMTGRPVDDYLVNEIELAIRDAARRGAVQTWGRPRSNPGEVTPATERPIPEDYWDQGRFNIFTGESADGKGRHIRHVNIYGTHDYADLKFNRKEILKEWPKAHFLRRLLDIRRYARAKLTTGTKV